MKQWIISLSFDTAFKIALIGWILSGLLIIIAIVLFLMGSIEEGEKKNAKR